MLQMTLRCSNLVTLTIKRSTKLSERKCFASILHYGTQVITHERFSSLINVIESHINCISIYIHLIFSMVRKKIKWSSNLEYDHHEELEK